MKKGLSLHIGLNTVDPNHYAGWDGQLVACENDAEDMKQIAVSKGFNATALLTKEATSDKVIKAINDAAQSLESGDIFFLTYSGHGGQLKDLNNDEDDQLDETWCLYDRQLVDDEINECFTKFKEGVRILSASDSCHSGTVVKEAFFKTDLDMLNSNIDKNGRRYRFAPTAILNKVYRQNKELYDTILSNRKIKETKDKVKSSVLLISGCQDNQLSLDGAFNGLFTGKLLATWDNGSFNGSYIKFHKQIKKQMPPTQTPNYFWTGTYNKLFESEKPFSI